MKESIVLFLVMVSMCQAYLLLPQFTDRTVRQGNTWKKEEPNLQTLHIPDSYKSPKFKMPSGIALRQLVLQPPQPTVNSRLAELDEMDKKALDAISPDDRNLLLNELTQQEREALLEHYENGSLNEVLPIDETRFGELATGGLAGIAAKIGAGAGRYLGGRLAGSLGAKLGAAAGAYLAAAAASRIESTFRGRNSNRSPNLGPNMAQASVNPGLQFGYGTNYGGVLVSHK